MSEYISAAVSDRGLNESRPENEDSFVNLPQHGLFAVADGVGGAQAGEVASQMAVEILSEAFANMDKNADPEDTMRIALHRANEAIFQMSRDIPQLSSMATTIAAVHVSGDMATIGHVGDSRVYRVDANGRLFRETDDHSIVEEEVRAGRMTPEQALIHPSRNIISRALGADESVTPDIKCVLIHPGTTFLLCSDGITRHIEDGEIEQLLNSEFGPEDICARMKDICFSRGAEDNLTAVILRFPAKAEATAVRDIEETEEATLAGVRRPEIVEPEVTGSVNVADDGTAEPRAGILSEDPADDETYLTETPQELFDGKSGENELQGASEAAPTAAGTMPISSEPLRNLPPQAENTPASRGSAFSVLALLIGIVIGTALGTVAGYFLLRNSLESAKTQTPAISVQKSSNVPLTSFEERRRIVDADPAAYLNANAATPQEADDFFWLGRALLLTNKPIEAKRAFEQARSLLPLVQETANVKPMQNEIAMALAILDSPQAVEAFAKEVSAARPTSGADTNANSAAPGVRMVR